MSPDRKATILAGSFYLSGILAGILSISYAIDDPNYLVLASSNSNGVLIAALFHLLMAPLYVGIAILLYPILKKYNQWLAVGFASFRLIAGVFIILGVIILLLLLSLSQEFAKAGSPDMSYFKTLGVLFQTGRDLVNHVATVLSVSFGGLMFYSLLYQAKLIPRWLSVWGLAGTILAILASVLFLFHIIGIITPLYMILNIPMALQEIVMAIWLIVKGFDQPVKITISENA